MATEFSLDFKNKYRTLLANNFNLDELQVLAGSLGIDFEEIRGSSKSLKVLELIDHMRRRGMLDDLVRASITFHSPSKVDWSVLGNEAKPFLPNDTSNENQRSNQREADDEIRHKGQMKDDDAIQGKNIEDIGPIKQRRALLVGINNFDDPKYNPLKFCENDANAMTEKLQRLGFQCTKMLGSNQGSNLYPTQVNILDQLDRICNIIEREDLTLLYFATHGVRFGDDQVPYLVAKDTRSSKTLFEKTALSIDLVIEMLKKSKSRRHVLLLDACHVGVDRGDDDEQEKFRKYVYERAQGIALLAASAADQTAVEQDGHGLFTRFLLDGLSDKADRDKKGFITTTDLSNYVLSRVRDWYDTRNSHRQDPTYRIEGIGDMVLAELQHVSNNLLPYTEMPSSTPLLDVSDINLTVNLFSELGSSLTDLYTSFIFLRARLEEYTTTRKENQSGYLNEGLPSNLKNNVSQVISCLKRLQDAIDSINKNEFAKLCSTKAVKTHNANNLITISDRLQAHGFSEKETTVALSEVKQFFTIAMQKLSEFTFRPLIIAQNGSKLKSSSISRDAAGVLDLIFGGHLIFSFAELSRTEANKGLVVSWGSAILLDIYKCIPDSAIIKDCFIEKFPSSTNVIQNMKIEFEPTNAIGNTMLHAVKQLEANKDLFFVELAVPKSV